MINTILLMIPFFILAILSWWFIDTEIKGLVITGWTIIALLFTSMFGAMIIFKTPSQDKINRREWKDKTPGEKVKWKLKRIFNKK